MTGRRPVLVFIASLMFAGLVSAQVPAFPVPAATSEAVSDAQDFPYLPPLHGTRLVETKRIDEPLEVKQASADDEPVLAGMSYVRKTYDRPGHITAIVLLNAYRDALFAAGWKLIDVTRLEEIPIQPETVNVAAHYSLNGRNVYARLSQEPGGPYAINVADVGAEDWESLLDKQCRVTLSSIHFDLDRSTIAPESTATLEKAAELVKAKRSWQMEVQGHMDNIGPEGDALRQVLSEARARAVAGRLATFGAPASRLTSKGYGKTRPVADNDSDLGRARNRRIELVRTDCATRAMPVVKPR